MNRLVSILLWLTLALGLMACGRSEAVSDDTADCPAPTPATQLYSSAEPAVCFLYPTAYIANPSADGRGVELYVTSILNTEAPLAIVNSEPANGRTLEEITAQRLADYAFPGTTAEPFTLGGAPASLLNDLPGQDINRRVIALHGDTAYDLVIYRTSPDYGAVADEAAVLFETITASWAFATP